MGGGVGANEGRKGGAGWEANERGSEDEGREEGVGAGWDGGGRGGRGE